MAVICFKHVLAITKVKIHNHVKWTDITVQSSWRFKQIMRFHSANDHWAFLCIDTRTLLKKSIWKRGLRRSNPGPLHATASFTALSSSWSVSSHEQRGSTMARASTTLLVNWGGVNSSVGTISPSDTDLSRTTTELWEISVLFTGEWRIIKSLCLSQRLLVSQRFQNFSSDYNIILDGLEGDTRIYCQRC